MESGRVIEILQELVRIPSINPGFPGGMGEQAAGEYVQRFFMRLGLPCEVQPVEGSRSNIIGTLPGASPRTLLLEAHMDTVQVQGMSIAPYGAELKEGKVYGRGACDTKASLAAMLAAVEALALGGVRPPLNVQLAAVVDEEITYRGVSALAAGLKEKAGSYAGAIVGEPTGLELIAAHKGCCRFYVDVQGISVHSSNPDLGINAIDKMVDVLAYLREYGSTVYPPLAHPLTGPPTHCVSLIEGGVAPNTVPGFCRITVDRRTVPGEEPLEVHRVMKERLEELQLKDPQLRLAVSAPFIIDYALDTAVEAEVVRHLQSSAQRLNGQARVLGAAYCSDASKLARAGIPAVVFGPGDIGQAHTADEWVEAGEVIRAADIILDTILSYS